MTDDLATHRLTVFTGEIFPTEIRGQGTAVGMFNQFAASIIILVAGPIALNNIGW